MPRVWEGWREGRLAWAQGSSVSWTEELLDKGYQGSSRAVYWLVGWLSEENSRV